MTPERRRLPAERNGITHKFVIKADRKHIDLRDAFIARLAALKEKLPEAVHRVIDAEIEEVQQETSPGQTYKGYLNVGLYDDGSPGEIFLKMDRQGSEVSGFADAWAIAISMLLQHGVSLHTIVDKFKAMRFEPSGMTETDGIRIAKSPVDYVCHYLARRFKIERDV
jgi:ribonucleoside-diphosphate reductase alpha chain